MTTPNTNTRLVATDALRGAVRTAKAHGLPQYRLADLAGFGTPGHLSHVLIGACRVRPDDVRARRLAAILTIPFDDAFVIWRPCEAGEVNA